VPWDRDQQTSGQRRLGASRREGEPSRPRRLHHTETPRSLLPGVVGVRDEVRVAA